MKQQSIIIHIGKSPLIHWQKRAYYTCPHVLPCLSSDVEGEQPPELSRQSHVTTRRPFHIPIERNSFLCLKDKLFP